MIIVKLQGGLGNQMFQYAAGRSLAKRLGVELKLDVTSAFGDKAIDRSRIVREYLLDSYDIKAEITTIPEIHSLRGQMSSINPLMSRVGRCFVKKRNLFGRLFKADTRYCEPTFDFDSDFFGLSDNIYVEGYFQSEKYFVSIDDEIRKAFFDAIRRYRAHTWLHHLLARVAGCEVADADASYTNTVAVGVRRGEFVSDAKIRRIHGFCDVDYFDSAMQLLERYVADPVFVVISDDIEWCKRKLDYGQRKMLFVQETVCPHELLGLFSGCSHAIISNSAFFWWGAWLNDNPGKIVVAPEKWFASKIITKDLLLCDWIKL